jgi:hypothetical protein
LRTPAARGYIAAPPEEAMLARFSRSFPNWQLWRLVLVLLLTPALVAAPAFMAGSVAVAQDDEEEDEDSDDEDDEDSGDEDSGDDESEEEDDFEGEEEEDEEEEGEPQPAVTAGGMFTKKSYPVAELERPLTVIQGMFEVRGGIDIDVSDETAFELFRLKLDGRYGLADHVELQAVIDFLISGDRALLLPPAPVEGEDEVGGVTLPVGLFGLGLEGALYYDMVHFRSIAALTLLPKAGAPEEDDFGFDLILGVPFRYRIKPQIAIIALDEIMTIHLAGGKPDLTVGVGGVFQVIPQVALTARAEIFVPAFNTKFVTVPLTAAAQFSPNNQFDIGIEFTLPVDVRNEETRFSKRSALLFVQTRL